jgi:hypothetical protein|tara:strand:- start:864 stop:1034 length:171 start_codon:yes stop_codon:yes gene_type:complete
MSDEQQESQAIVEESVSASASTQSSDSKADAMAILVMFTAAVAFCVFYISGWSFDL